MPRRLRRIPRRIRERLRELTSFQILTRAAWASAVLILLVFIASVRKIEPLPLSSRVLQFDHHRAHRWMTDLSKKFPGRVTWAPQRRAAAVWLKEQLTQLGYTARGMNFTEVIAGKQYTNLENVYAEKTGTTFPNERIVLMAHYDITDTTVEGAMDNASGVGVVLELARLLAKQQTQRTIVFLLTDSEEFGAFWGARSFARQYAHTDQIIAALNFDFVSAEKQTRILTLCDGLKEGFSPLWLREMGLESLRSLGGVKVLDMMHIEEFAQRAMQIPPGDHGAFLAAGIPTITWVGQSDDFAHVMTKYHHTPSDVAEALKPESFIPFGRGAERVVYSIDELARAPGASELRDSSYWKISPFRYLEGWGAFAIHVLLFLPFLAFSIAKFRRVLKRAPAGQIQLVVRNEIKKIGILLGSLLLGYVVMMMLPALDVVTLYETFPATQKSRILYTPNLLAFLLVFGAIGVVYFILSRVFADRGKHPEQRELRHALHTVMISSVVALAFLKNSYLGVLLLLPPTYSWIFLSARRRVEDRLLNTLLILGGTLSVVAITLVFATVFHIGVIYWYMFLAATYGLFSAYSIVLFLMALTVMIRLFRAFVI